MKLICPFRKGDRGTESIAKTTFLFLKANKQIQHQITIPLTTGLTRKHFFVILQISLLVDLEAEIKRSHDAPQLANKGEAAAFPFA